jgi:hypothetical protein
MKCPQHSAVQPSHTGSAGIGLTHDDVAVTHGPVLPSQELIDVLQGLTVFSGVFWQAHRPQ